MLSPDQIQHFITRGYVHLEGCFDCSPGSLAHGWVADSWKRNGIDPDDFDSWPKDKIHMPCTESALVSGLAPTALSAMHELCGGAERIPSDAIRWGNGFIANYGLGRDEPWQAPGPDVTGWHKDGDFFRHFLDSPEQALLVIVVYSDIGERGGGTFFSPDSIRPVAELLRDHPGGVEPGTFSKERLIDQCSEFGELTARAGDVVLMHPFMLHASSANHSRNARFMSNPCCSFVEPMQFHRTDGSEHSPVELAVLHALGVPFLDFQIEGERQEIVPERRKRQLELLRLEQERMAATAATTAAPTP